MPVIGEESGITRVIAPPSKDNRTKKFKEQTVMDSGIREDFLDLKKEHGRVIPILLLQDKFKGRESDFQRFLINQLQGDFNDIGVDGIIGPRTFEDASRVNWIDNSQIPDFNVKEKFTGEIPVPEITEITRDDEKGQPQTPMDIPKLGFNPFKGKGSKRSGDVVPWLVGRKATKAYTKNTNPGFIKRILIGGSSRRTERGY